MIRDALALTRFIDSRHSAPHEWGREANDCCSFPLAAVEAQTGVRVAPKLKWKDRRSALRVIRRFGSIEAAFDAYFERVAPAFAKRGDIAGVPDETFGIHTMLIEGDMLVTPGDHGNRRCKRSAMICAWDATKVKPDV